MSTPGLRAVFAATLVLGAIACREKSGGTEAGIRLEPAAIEMTAEQGTSREATIVATSSVSPQRRIYVRAQVDGSGLESAETSSYDTYSLVTVRSLANLLPGTYAGTVIVTACVDEACGEPIAGAPLQVPYTVQVLPPMVSRSLLELETAQAGAAVEADVAVTLPPGASGFGVEVTTGAGWLTVAGRTATGFRVRAAPQRRGVYDGALRVTAGTEARVVRVRCSVPPRPMGVTPASLALSGESGTTTLATLTTVLPDDADSYSLEIRAPFWLRQIGWDPGTPMFEAGPLPPGTYWASLTFRAGDSTVVVPVEYRVSPAADLAHGIVASPAGLTLAAAPGQQSDDVSLTVFPPSGMTLSAVRPTVDYGGSPSGWLSLARTTTGFRVLASATRVDPGQYTADVILSAGAGIPDVRVPIAFTCGTGLVRPHDRNITWTPASTIDDFRGSVRVRTVGMPGLPWQATSDNPRLFVSAEGRAGEVLEYLVYQDLLRDLETFDGAFVTLTSDPGSPPTSFWIRIERRIGAIARITPRAQPAGKPNRLLVRGRGFGWPGDPVPELQIDGVGPVSVLRRSTQDLEVEVPALPAGTYTLRLASAFDVPGLSATFMLVDPGALPLTTFLDAGPKRGLVYDPVRRAISFADPGRGVIVRRAFTDGGWSTTERSAPDLVDIGLAPDGETLLAATTGSLLYLDPDTLDDREPAAAPGPRSVASTPSEGLPLTSNGMAWLFNLYDPGWYFGVFDLTRRSFIQTPLVHVVDETFTSVSRDRARVLFSQPRRQPALPIQYWEVFDAVPRTAPGDVPAFFLASQSDDGGRVLMDGTRLYDRSFSLLGTAEAPAPYRTRAPSGMGYGAALSPDGARAYAVAYSALDPSAPPRLFAFDASQAVPGGGPLPILGSRDLVELPPWDQQRYPEAPAALVTLAPDEQTLFLADGEALLVLPTSEILSPAPGP